MFYISCSNWENSHKNRCIITGWRQIKNCISRQHSQCKSHPGSVKPQLDCWFNSVLYQSRHWTICWGPACAWDLSWLWGWRWDGHSTRCSRGHCPAASGVWVCEGTVLQDTWESLLCFAGPAVRSQHFLTLGCCRQLETESSRGAGCRGWEPLRWQTLHRWVLRFAKLKEKRKEMRRREACKIHKQAESQILRGACSITNHPSALAPQITVIQIICCEPCNIIETFHVWTNVSVGSSSTWALL